MTFPTVFSTLQVTYLAIRQAHNFGNTRTRGDVAIYIRTRHLDFSRAKCLRYARIIHNWITFGYTPQRFV